MSEKTDEILRQVRAERKTHEQKGFDNHHDDTHGGVHHLVMVCAHYTHRRPSNPDEQGYYGRDNLIKAASLLIAAIECLDRSKEDGPGTPR